MQSLVNTMEKFNTTIVNLYTAQTKLSHQKVTDMMDAETLLTADELLQYGFVGSIDGEAVVTNKTPAALWDFHNQAILNVYNATPTQSQKSAEMDFTKITEAINNGFSNLAEKLGITNKTEDAKDALAGFADSIVNAVKESVPTDESIQKLVDTAIANSMATAFEKLPESVTNAISTAVAEGLKNTTSAEDLKKVSDELEATKKSIANRTAGNGKARNSAKTDDAEDETDHAGVSWGEQDEE